jgi:outer membrane protein OmpA-like peptidoglycan-associated protein
MLSRGGVYATVSLEPDVPVRFQLTFDPVAADAGAATLILPHLGVYSPGPGSVRLGPIPLRAQQAPARAAAEPAASDADRDGVGDYADQCPNTAAGTQVDADGCPLQRDSDRDGVIDASDRCPTTPSTARVDATGCPLAELPPVNGALVVRNITFQAGTAVMLPSSFAGLDRIAAAISATPGSRWEIGGHTDAVGDPALNQRLSQEQAQAVLVSLVERGVPAAALSAVGYGAARPVAPNTDAAGRAQNRRIDIKRLQ